MKIWCAVAMTFVLMAGAWAQAVQPRGQGSIVEPQRPGGSVVITGRRRGDPRTPVAVPYFATAPGAEAVGKEMAEVIAYDLDFTGVFRILLPGQYPPTFRGLPADPTKIDFSSWRKTPAEYLVYAYISTEGDKVVGEFRLFDIATGSQLTGKRLVGDKRYARLVAHQFSDEITKYATGYLGCATSQIVFSGSVGGHKEIYIADYDGANVRQLTHYHSISILPKISPNGKKVAFLSYKDRYPWLYVLDLATGAVTPLSRHVGLNASPAWAPDSRSLAIVLSKDGNPEIYRVNVDGSGLQRLTHNSAVDTEPTFSPDGRQIAFISDRDGLDQVFVMGADGSNPRRLSLTFSNAYDPTWSPDGKMIAFIIQHGGFQVAVMNADGSDVRTITHGGINESPTWSPDSHHVMYCRSGARELRTFNVNTPFEMDRRVQHLRLPAEGPNWGPRR